MEKRPRGRQRLDDIDHEGFMVLLNECGNITRAAIMFQMDPNVVKMQLLRKNLRIGRRFHIVKNEDIPVTGRIEKKMSGPETIVVGGRSVTITELTDTLNELGNISKASLKLGLVDSGIRTTLKNRGYEMKIEYILVPADEVQPRNRPISFA
jgi:hypothetical protein